MGGHDRDDQGRLEELTDGLPERAAGEPSANGRAMSGTRSRGCSGTPCTEVTFSRAAWLTSPGLGTTNCTRRGENGLVGTACCAQSVLEKAEELAR